MRTQTGGDSVRSAIPTISQKDIERMELQAQYEEFEAKSGRIVTQPIQKRDASQLFTAEVYSKMAAENTEPKRKIAKKEKALKSKSYVPKSRVKTALGAVMQTSKDNRLEALRRGKKIYIGGAPCPKGHWERRVSGNMCVECDREHSRRNALARKNKRESL